MDAKVLRQLAADPAEFRAMLLIDADGVQRPLREVAEGWQLADFEALDPGLRAVAGQRVVDPCLRFWLERPRGHSKTSDIAIAVAWLLFASRRPLRIAAAAADSDQAGLLRDAIQRLTQLNPWLGELLDVQRLKVINRHTRSEVEIIASDAPSSYGKILDCVVCDELCHWAKRDLWDSLLSTAAKRRSCLLLVITNAGFQTSWQWQVREAIRTDPSWRFSRLDGPVATWITADRLAEQERLLPRAAYDRLWQNQWSSGEGDCFSAADILAAVDAELPQHPVEGETYVAGLDLGIKRDASGLVVVGKDRSGHLAVRHVRRWQATAGGQVELQHVENAIADLHAQFRFRHVALDPWQGSHLCQRLAKRGVPIAERSQGGSKLVEQAIATLEVLRDRRLSLPDQPALLSDLRRARVIEKSYGYRIESPRDSSGHGDLLSALSIALATAKELRGGKMFTGTLRTDTEEFRDRQAAMFVKILDIERQVAERLRRPAPERGETTRFEVRLFES